MDSTSVQSTTAFALCSGPFLALLVPEEHGFCLLRSEPIYGTAAISDAAQQCSM
jgi:hypothetical protein